MIACNDDFPTDNLHLEIVYKIVVNCVTMNFDFALVILLVS